MSEKYFTVILVNLAALLFSVSSGAWVIDQTYDNQSLGERCDNWSAAGRSIVTNIESSSGTNSCRLRIETTDGDADDPGTGWGQWGGVIRYPSLLRKGNEIWVRIRTFMPVGFDYNSSSRGSRLKFLRLHTRDDANANYGYDDWYINPYPRIDDDTSFLAPFNFIYEGAPRNNPVGSDPEHTIRLGTWETYEYYVKFDNTATDNGGQARVRMWKNGKLMGDITREKTLATSGAYSEALFIFTYWNGATPKNQEMYVDDLILTNETPSGRDEFGNPYVGMGGVVAKPPLADPLPPSSIH